MLFKQSFHEGLLDGSITVTFRRWSRPRVKLGGWYRLNPTAVLKVTSLDEVDVGEISEAEARRSGFPDRASLLAELERGGAPAPVYRVAFRCLPLPDKRERLARDSAVTAEDAAALTTRLKRMDRSSRHGPWTQQTLALIDRHPRTAASQLAKRAGRETQAFKTDVRKLKKLGLTLSHDIGYELSPRGRAFVERMTA